MGIGVRVIAVSGNSLMSRPRAWRVSYRSKARHHAISAEDAQLQGRLPECGLMAFLIWCEDHGNAKLACFKVSLFHTATILVLVERLMTEFAAPLNEFFV